MFFRSEIPLHMDTIKYLKSQCSHPLVFCPVGKTSFSFIESHPPEFVVVLGDAALQLALTMLWKVPILVSLVDHPPTDSRIVFLDTQQPYAMQIQLLKKLMPAMDTIWYPYVSERLAPCHCLKQAVASAGIRINSHRLNDPRTLPGALRKLAEQTTAIIFPPDPGIMNNAIIQSIFLASFRSKTPAVSFSEALVKRGAIFAYVLSPENLAASISEIIDEVLVNGQPQNSKRVFEHWELILNMTILEKFKLPISDQIRDAAKKLF